jgi:hypothetical protein
VSSHAVIFACTGKLKEAGTGRLPDFRVAGISLPFRAACPFPVLVAALSGDLSLKITRIGLLPKLKKHSKDQK